METNAPMPNVVSETVERRIRTFAGDMKIVKDGGKPDLVPYSLEKSNTASVPRESSVVLDPIVPRVEMPISASPPASVQPTEPLPQHEATQGFQYSTDQNNIPKPIRPKSSFIETYAGDFSDKIKDEHASVATVLAAEQDSLPNTSKTVPKNPRDNYFYIIAGVTLLIISGVAVYSAYERYRTNTLPIVLTQTVPAPLFVDEREQITGNGSALEQAIIKSVAHPLAQGNARLLYDDTSTESIFSRLSFVPGVLVRNIRAGGSVAGVVNIDGVQSPFFILSVTSYGNSFSGMLSWETVMPYTLDGLFPPYPLPRTSVYESATSSLQAGTTAKAVVATTSVAAIFSSFHDEVVSNHDVRVYRDAAGKSVMLYGYWDRSTLVIARDSKAFTEITQRIAHARTQ